MPREILNFNADWLFSKLEGILNPFDTKAYENDFDDSLFDKVALPHTYNSIDGCSGRTGVCQGGENYYRGLSCYRKYFEYSPCDKSVYIEFGAVSIVAVVFVNGKLVGRHEGGYSAFRFDITDHLISGKNTICVFSDNSPTDYIAPITDQGDFTKMGGIYRDVKLIVTDKVHMDLSDFGSSGVFVTPYNITNKKADVNVRVKLSNESDTKKEVYVKLTATDAQNNVINTLTNKVLLEKESKAEEDFNFEITNPTLWQGVENPYLYNVCVEIFDDISVIDGILQTFGIRKYRIDRENGFYLNDKYVNLCGTNYHQDSFENGWAMSDNQRKRDFEMMLDMGCNTVRMAHYQHCQHEYELCDKLGLTVWTEIGIVNRVSADDKKPPLLKAEFFENAKIQLIELIRQNYNHPSIIVWGISNELWQMSDEIYKMYVALVGVARNEDKTRLITAADNQFWGDFLRLPVDVVGYNRYFGWYKDAGPAESFGEWLDEYYQHKANHPICVSEYGGGGAISQHKDNIVWEDEIDPWGMRHFENYQSSMHEKIWAQFSKRRYLWGKYIWCMFDFASDGREEGDTKGLNDKGLVTRNRIPKDSYFYYKSVWNKSPMLHITQKRFVKRPCLVPVIKAYSTADECSLYVNDEFIGTTTPNADNKTVFEWHSILLKKGENKIAVKANAENTVLCDDVIWYGE